MNMTLKIAIIQSRFRTQVAFSGYVKACLVAQGSEYVFDQIRLSKIIHGDIDPRPVERLVIANALGRLEVELFTHQAAVRDQDRPYVKKAVRR